MANSSGSLYTRPADLREQQYMSFEASGIVADSTVVLLPVLAAGEGTWRVHEALIHIVVAEANTVVSIEDSSGNVLFKTSIDGAAVIPLSWGAFPWGFRCAELASVDLIVASGTTFEVSVAGYATR